MGGSASVRGFLLQTIICLLDALEHSNSNWTSVTLEPNLKSEKVDILWSLDDRTKIVQVKSSQNQISKRNALQWARELEFSVVADEYDLVLLGPCSQAVIEMKRVGRVNIPFPRNIDIQGLLEQAAHKLDRYYEIRGFNKTSPDGRELIILGMTSKLEGYSTLSLEIVKGTFDRVMLDWRSLLHPLEKTGVEEIDIIEYLKVKNFKNAAKKYGIPPDRLRDALSTLSERHRRVIELRLGLGGHAEMSYEEVAKAFGVDVERIEYLERTGLVALQDAIKKQER